MLRCGKFLLSLERPLIMGIVNLTPDSFSGDGRRSDVGQAVEHARRQIAAGADIIDLGAESSRPGAIPTPLDEELARLTPALKALTDCPVPISVDTYKPEVMQMALSHGASLINDIFALRHPGALAAVKDSDCAICLMHMQGEPLSMQQAPDYADVVRETREFLAGRIAAATAAGIARERLILDPGFGFGKSVEHNFTLLSRLDEISCDGFPILAGLSRKSMLGAVTGRPTSGRMSASLAAALLAVERGARIVRVHDVAETRDALCVWQAAKSGPANNGISARPALPL
jgi:dihydropteroate synthase